MVDAPAAVRVPAVLLAQNLHDSEGPVSAELLANEIDLRVRRDSPDHPVDGAGGAISWAGFGIKRRHAVAKHLLHRRIVLWLAEQSVFPIFPESGVNIDREEAFRARHALRQERLIIRRARLQFFAAEHDPLREFVLPAADGLLQRVETVAGDGPNRSR